MVSSIVDLEAFRVQKAQTGVGQAFCIQCDHQWTATVPTGVVRLECPKCHTLKGLLKFEYKPPTGQLVRECDCGNQLFYLTPEGHMCCNCGIYQRY